MKSAETKEKNCKTCKYFMEHYVILSSMQLSPVGGHCKRYKRSKKSIEATDSCARWEQNENVSAVRQKQLTGFMRDMDNRLKQIQLILSVDNK